jgi:hypothetical protein
MKLHVENQSVIIMSSRIERITEHDGIVIDTYCIEPKSLSSKPTRNRIIIPYVLIVRFATRTSVRVQSTERPQNVNGKRVNALYRNEKYFLARVHICISRTYLLRVCDRVEELLGPETLGLSVKY